MHEWGTERRLRFLTYAFVLIASKFRTVSANCPHIRTVLRGLMLCCQQITCRICRGKRFPCHLLYVICIRFHGSPSLHVQWGNTPLLRAAQEGHTEVACFLLENGSTIEEQNNVSRTEGVLSKASCDQLIIVSWSMCPSDNPSNSMNFHLWPSRSH